MKKTDIFYREIDFYLNQILDCEISVVTSLFRPIEILNYFLRPVLTLHFDFYASVSTKSRLYKFSAKIEISQVQGHLDLFLFIEFC